MKRVGSGLGGDKTNGFHCAPKMSTYSGALISVNMTWMRREWRASSAGVAIIFVLIKGKCISRSAPPIAASIGSQPTLKCSLLRFRSMQLYNEFFPWKRRRASRGYRRLPPKMHRIPSLFREPSKVDVAQSQIRTEAHRLTTWLCCWLLSSDRSEKSFRCTERLFDSRA